MKSFWQKLEEAKAKGMTAEEIEKLESLESAIAYHQNKVDEYEKEIKSIEKISEEEVFDITVDNESHTYWTQGCNISNCAEALLADKECCNLAELAINNISLLL